MMPLAIISLARASVIASVLTILFERYSIGFLLRRPLSLQSGISSNRSTVTESDFRPLLSGEIGRSWPVGCICEVIGLLCRRTVPRTFYVRENQILKRGPQLPQSDSAVTINCSGTVIALLSSSVRDAK
jgi:hypothetical protein